MFPGLPHCNASALGERAQPAPLRAWDRRPELLPAVLAQTRHEITLPPPRSTSIHDLHCALRCSHWPVKCPTATRLQPTLPLSTMAAAAMPVVGLYGLAVMGQNLALNIAEKGFPIAVCNRSPEKVRVCPSAGPIPQGILRGFCTPLHCSCASPGGCHCGACKGRRGSTPHRLHRREQSLLRHACLVPCSVTPGAGHAAQVQSFVGAIAKPRKVIMLVKAGAPVDATIDLLKEYLEVRGRPSCVSRLARTRLRPSCPCVARRRAH